MSTQRTRYGIFLIFALALTGCISVGGGDKKAPSSIYTLRADAPEKTPRSTGGTAVAVAKPELPAEFGTERIALYLDDGKKLDYYADAKWSARLDDLLQEFVIQRAQQNLPGNVVGTTELGRAARYRLAVTFMDLAPVYASTPDAAPRLDVAMTVTVVSLPDEKVKTQFSVKKSAPASANTLTTITAELGSLLQVATDEALRKAAPYL